jgi:hypothetical protein
MPSTTMLQVSPSLQKPHDTVTWWWGHRMKKTVKVAKSENHDHKTAWSQTRDKHCVQCMQLLVCIPYLHSDNRRGSLQPSSRRAKYETHPPRSNLKRRIAKSMSTLWNMPPPKCMTVSGQLCETMSFHPRFFWMKREFTRKGSVKQKSKANLSLQILPKFWNFCFSFSNE